MDILLISQRLKDFFGKRALKESRIAGELRRLSEAFEDFFSKRLSPAHLAADSKNPLALPSKILPFPKPLSCSVLGVDGGEAQFSHHEGLTLEIASVASVYIDYRSGTIQDFVDLKPFEKELDSPLTLRRFFLELETALLKTEELQPDLLLLDGSLIPWPLLRLNSEERRLQLSRWREVVEALVRKTMVFGFVSDSNASELVNTLKRLLFFDFREAVLDKYLLKKFLKEQPQYKESFFIFNLEFGEPLLTDISVAYFLFGDEVCRLEWLGKEQGLGMILALLYKGKGYPSVLKEAHKLASLSQKDREAILSLARSLAARDAKLSLKELQKRL